MTLQFTDICESQQTNCISQLIFSLSFYTQNVKIYSDSFHITFAQRGDLWKQTTRQLQMGYTKVIAVLLHKLNVPDEEVYEVTDQITRRKFSMMFDNFQAYDVQETRRVSREEGRLEGRIEGERAGRIEGERLHLIKQVIKRIELQYSVNQIAESLLEPLDIIQPIYDIALQQGSDYDANLILDELNSKNIQ